MVVVSGSRTTRYLPNYLSSDSWAGRVRADYGASIIERESFDYVFKAW
jgi:hypothetical protein